MLPLCLTVVFLLMNAAHAADLVVVQVAPQKGALRTGMLAHLDHVNAICNTVRLV